MTLFVATYSLLDRLRDSLKISDLTSIVALGFSLYSVCVSFSNSKRLEGYKRLIDKAKDKVEREENQVEELRKAFKDARLIIEKIDRNISPSNESREEILGRLEEKYVNIQSFLDVEHSAVIPRVHEQKNRLRHALENLATTDLTQIKNEETEIFKKLNIIRASSSDNYEKQMKN